jgi:cell division protein FtsL
MSEEGSVHQVRDRLSEEWQRRQMEKDQVKIGL